MRLGWKLGARSDARRVTPSPAAVASFAASLTSSADLSATSITTALGTPALPPLAGKMAVCTANLRAEPVSVQSSEPVCVSVFNIAGVSLFSVYCT